MGDLPDWYTLVSEVEAEAYKIRGGADAAKSAAPTAKDVYLATDTKKLYICIADGAWTGFDASILVQGILTLYDNLAGGGFQLKNIADPTAAQDAATKAYVDLFTLLTTFNAHKARHQDGGDDELSLAGLSGEPADTVNKTLFGAYSMLYADTDDTPVALSIAASRVVGRKSTGGIVALAKADILTIINVTEGADVTADNAPKAHKTSHQDGGADELSLSALAGSNTALTTPRINEAVDLNATSTELNLLDLSAQGLTAGELLVATGVGAAAWQSTGVKLSAPDISGAVTAASALTLPAHSSGVITLSSHPSLNLAADNILMGIRGGLDAGGRGANIFLAGKDHGYAGRFMLQTPNAAGDTDLTRLTITGVLTTAVATFTNCTVTAPSFEGGDFKFKNGYRFTEAEELGLLSGIALVAPDGRIVKVFN